MRHALVHTVWLSTLCWLFGLTMLLLPAQVSAQTQHLHVTLHDLRGTAIAGVMIIVRTEDGAELARQTTGSDGSVSFRGLSQVVRVLVDGQPRGGPRLYQLGDDARGVRVDLHQASAPLTLNLRAERDGLVMPDPATMLSLEEGGPFVFDDNPIPTAAIATPAPLPTARRTAIASTERAQPGGGESEAGWVPPVTLLIMVVAVIVLRLVQKLRSTR